MSIIKIGSRKSQLAIKQTEAVIKKLKEHFPNDTFEIVGISTKGDRQLDKSLQSFGGKGVFIKEIETALLSGEIDMAVHSAKDMPTEICDGLTISAALLRDDRSDVLVHFGDTKLSDIKIIGTGSARRQSQAEKLFPNTVFKPIRGNIGTRLEKVKNGEYDAVIMARAAINRLAVSDVKIENLGDNFICAAGQGILAIETAVGKADKYAQAINDKVAMTELKCERAFLQYTGGGCHAPCGASAEFNGKEIKMCTFFKENDKEIYLEMFGNDPILLGKKMAEITLDKIKEEINKTLVKHSRFGNVVRLKGGDPFIFGRGGEEIIALIENNIDYEIVPGISSCYSAAEYCGIPVTHRGVATSFHVITGHEKVGNETVNYSALAKLSGTLVFLMGLSSAENISNKLIENGKSENTPVAVISSGTTPRQKYVTGTLNNLSALAKQMTSPAIILVGDVVNLKHDWFKQKNTKILTTATPLMNKSIKKAATDFDITELPLIKTVPINFDLFSKADITHFSYIVFTSANGVEIFFEYLQKSKTDIRTLGDTKFAVVGKKTADALASYGIYADMVPQIHSGRELARLMCEKCSKNDNILLIRAENGASTIPNILSENNINFTDMHLYRTETDNSKQELLNLCLNDTDYVILSSGSAAKAFSEMADTSNIKLISIGNETTKSAEKCGLKIYKTADNATAESIIDCIRGDTK